MSYTVEVPATVMEPEFTGGSGAYPAHPSSRLLRVTTFAGGERGRMVQITHDPAFACMTMEQLDVLIDVLLHARQRSLADHPRYGVEVDD